MFKKIFTSLLTIALLVSFAACSSEGEKKPDTTTAADTAATEIEATETTEAATEPEPETEPPKRDKFNYIDFYTAADAGHSPVSLMSVGSSTAVRFKFDEGYLQDISVQCPSWSDNIGSLTFRVYKWDTDFATTVAGTPLAEEIFEDYADNDTLISEYSIEENAIGAGEYLFWIGDGVDSGGSGVGYWAQAVNTDDEAVIECYANGALSTANAPEASATIIIPAEMQ